MCAKRRSFIVQQILKTKSRCQSSSSLQSVPVNSNSHILFPELKSAKSTSQIDFVVGEDSSTPSLKSGSSSLSLDGTTGPSRNGGSSSLGSNGSCTNHSCEDNWEMKRIKRGHILNELLNTETTYVEEIRDILNVS